jgi:hypothetical protein
VGSSSLFINSVISPRGNAAVGDASSLGFVALGTKAPVGSVLANKKRRNLMSHNVVPPLKSPAPPAPEAMTLWKRLKHQWMLSTTEEVFHADGTSERVTRVLRSRHM